MIPFKTLKIEYDDNHLFVTVIIKNKICHIDLSQIVINDMNFKSLLIFVVFLTGVVNVSAHPVSYKGAFGLMSYNTSEMTEVMLTYSLSSQFALAGLYLKDAKSEFYIPRVNLLAKRWNNDDSQANIYLSAGIGNEKFNSKTYRAELLEFVADWEDRRYYIYFDHLYLKRDNLDSILLPEQDYNHSKLRLGTAPFLADYSDLNIWLIWQGEKHLDQKQIEMTQFLRFYMKNVLWEIGARSNGGWAFNYMVHF